MKNVTDRQRKLVYNTDKRKKELHNPLPHLNGKMAAQNLDFYSKFLRMTSDILTVQKSNCPLSLKHKALGGLDNNYYQAIPSHPAPNENTVLKYKYETTMKLM